METKVADVMTRRVIAAREEAGFKEIVAIMRDNRVSALPVVDDHNRVIGVVAEADLLVKEAEAAPQRAGWRWLLPSTEHKAAANVAGDLMTRPAITISRDASVAEAAALMSARRVQRLPVVDETGHLLGVVSRVDVLSVFSRTDYDIRDEIVHRIIVGELSLDWHAFDVEVKAGIVTITGQAESKAVAVQLLDAIRHVEGVVDVRDRLSHPREDNAGKPTFAPFGAFTPKG